MYSRKRRLQQIEREIEILEIKQNAEVDDKAQRDDQLFHSFAPGGVIVSRSHPLKPQTAEPGDERGSQNQKRVLRIPAHIEIITRREQPVFLYFRREQIVKQHDDREENHIFSGVKKQGTLSLKRRNTLCISSFSGKVRRKRCRQDVRGDLFSVSLGNAG